MAPGGKRGFHAAHTSTLTIGTERTVIYEAGERELVTRMLPGIAKFTHKPDVMAMAWPAGSVNSPRCSR
jgi:hypothetical protein